MFTTKLKALLFCAAILIPAHAWALTLNILNQTAIQRSYLSGAITVPASGSYSATASTIFPLSRDSSLVYDCKNLNVILTDGVNVYELDDALNYLNLVATGLGGAVVGYAGASAPSYEITIGGKDPSGNSQPSRLNQFTDTSVNFRNSYRNITGNGTTTVKSGSGTLHGIVINNNGTGGTITVYDNTAGSGTVMFTFTIGSPSGGLLSSSGVPGPIFIGPLGAEYATGLTIVTAGSSNNNITAVYQ